RYEGPVGVLNYAVDTPVERGALHVVPGSHRMDVLEHVDTFSHLGLDPGEWPWERAMPIEGEAGDAVIFHVKTIHGSKPNVTDQRRPVFIHRYRAAHDYVVVNATTAEKRKKAVKEKDRADKQEQRGLMVRGFRAWRPS
ncbi:MAG: phytanoyl-CoA dioxygenase family protein, partial [Phycisphaeraceae bacterium]|nr:phytanoyl-CoA dioxygenase family protein [Phycisphaeraceae bacterium]